MRCVWKIRIKWINRIIYLFDFRMNWTNKQTKERKKNIPKVKVNIAFNSGHGIKFSAIFIFAKLQKPIQWFLINNFYSPCVHWPSIARVRIDFSFLQWNFNNKNTTTTKHGHWCEWCLNYTWSFRCETVLCLHSQNSIPFIEWIVVK